MRILEISCYRVRTMKKKTPSEAMTRMRAAMPWRAAIAVPTATRFLRSFILGVSDHTKDLFGGRSVSIDVGRLDRISGDGDGIVRATLRVCG